nr:DUF397 domain-containing protein [Streptomyces sp. Termitarium-T10T-6]
MYVESSCSGSEGGQCVEFAPGAGAVHVRDSESTAGSVLRVSRDAWTGLLGLATAE